MYQMILRRIHHAGPTSPKRAFTLVEVLIVVVILGILAAIVIPQFTNAADDTKLNTLKQDLYRIRIQIEIYRSHHLDTPPSLTDFVDQMTQASNAQGQTAAPGTAGYPRGPYLRSMPNNPFTGSNTVGGGAVGTSDWFYDAGTGEFRANDTADHRTL